MAGGYIYFVSPVNGGPIRIGHSRLPLERLRALQVYSPVPLEIVATMQGDHFLEQWLHDHFRDDKLHGEWLRLTFHLSEVVEAARRGNRHPSLPHCDLIDAGPTARIEAVRHIKRLLGLTTKELADAMGVNHQFFTGGGSDMILVRAMRLLSERGIRFTVDDLNALLTQKRDAA